MVGDLLLFDCGRCWHGHTATKPNIAGSLIGTARARWSWDFEGHIAMAEAMSSPLSRRTQEPPGQPAASRGFVFSCE